MSAVLGLINGAANIGANAILGGIQHERNEELMHSQYSLNEKAADAADRRQRAQYNDLYTAAAKRKQLEEAGLSVGLAYGMQGVTGGGTAGAAQGGGSGLPSESAPYGDYFDLLQAEKTKAEIKNIEADTKKKEGEEGREKEMHEYNIAEIQANIDKIIADTDDKKAQTQLTKLKTEFQETENAIEAIRLSSAEDMSRTELRNARLQGDKTAEEVEALKKANRITDTQYKDLVKQAALQNQYLIQSIGEKKIQTRKAQAEIKKINEEVNRIIQETVKTHWEAVNEINFEQRFYDQLKNSRELQDLIGDQQERMAYIRAITSAISAGAAAMVFKGGGGQFRGLPQPNFYD